jgi:hypothetical protein
MNHTDVYILVIVKSSAGPRYVVSYRPAIPVSKVSFLVPELKRCIADTL